MFSSIRKYVASKLSKKFKLFLRSMLGLTIKKTGNPIIPKEELKIFELLKDEMHTVFDVGAREDLSFYEIKNNCEYHLFEPSIEAIESLKKKMALLNDHVIVLNEFGLSDKNEDNCIYYENSQSFIINPVLKEGIDMGRRYSLRKLDDYVNDHNVAHIDFLKIDAEGLDYKIILGGLDTIKNKVSYIQFEYWDGVQKFVDLLSSDFDLYLMMEPVLLKAIEGGARLKMTKEQKVRNYAKSINVLDTETIDLIDRVLMSMDSGGNILGINKNLKNVDIEKLTFNL